jgi:hypothetical protein
MKCSSKAGVVKHRLSSLDYYHLFGGPTPYPRPEATWLPPSPMSALPWGPKPPPPAGLHTPDGKENRAKRPPHEDSLTVIQCNLDKRGRRSLGWVLSMAEEHKADAVCLQEIKNVSWPTYALSAMGWNLYRHGKVGILARRATTELLSGVTVGEGVAKHHIHVWNSSKHHSMSISIQTPDGGLMIACAYAPSGVDDMTFSQRNVVSAQHAEIHAQSLLHAHSIICMDANETSCLEDRLQFRLNGVVDLSGSNLEPYESTMACYGKTHVNTRAHFRRDSAYPTVEDMTHVQPGPMMTVFSAIDVILSSKTLLNRLTTVAIDDRTKHWITPGTLPGTERTSYHKAVVSRWAWRGLWVPAQSQTERKSTLQGSRLNAGPDWSRWSDNRACRISEKVDTYLGSLKTIAEIRKIDHSRRLRAHQKRDLLLSLFKKVLMRAASDVLGVAKEPSPSPTAKHQAHTKWASLIPLVSRLLRHDLMGHFNDPIESDHPDLLDLVKWFGRVGVDLPTTKETWATWWPHRDTHRTDALLACSELTVTDKMARENPKQFYKLATGPLMVSNMDSLRSKTGIETDDAVIEDLCTAKLRSMGGTQPEPECISEDPAPEPNPALRSIMNAIKLEELTDMAREIDARSCAGHDAMAPKLLKAALLTEWWKEDLKGPDQHQQDTNHWRFSREMAASRRANKWVPLSGSLPPEGTYPKHYLHAIEPIHARNLLLRILNLCLITRNVPLSEKIGVVSALPKTTGQVYDLGAIRPITVGPTVNRFFHKILAHRLSALVLEHNLMDPAQFAYLPGKDIHEPINSVLECYKDRQRYGKPCYAIFYDISKAYDTVRWSSIRRGLGRLGLPKEFTEMVLNILEGTNLVMRTNIRGRVTPMVRVYQSIKQGCPLAPLLFTIVMDELHRELRTVGGYTLGAPNGPRHAPPVHSRGYSDDTTALADSLIGLKDMNAVVARFFLRHNFNVNAVKTQVTGMAGDGTPLTETIHWQADASAFTTVAPNKPIKHLGLLITMTQDWSPQIAKMRSTVLHTVSCLTSRRITLYQGCLLAAYVTGPKLETGLRHATIPPEEVEDWDARLAAALSASATLHSARLHYSGVSLVCRYAPITDLRRAAQVAQIMDSLLKPTELQPHYIETIGPMLRHIRAHAGSQSLHVAAIAHLHDQGQAAALLDLAEIGVEIMENKSCRLDRAEPAGLNNWGDVTCTFRGAMIPMRTRDKTDMWGSGFDPLLTLLPILHRRTGPPAALVRSYTRLPHLAAQIVSQYLVDPAPAAVGHLSGDTQISIWNSVGDIMATQCISDPRTKTYHHPHCPSTTVKNSGRRMNLFDVTQSGKRRPLTCESCLASWVPLLRRAKHFVWAMVCTDGSTIPTIRSTAAMAFVEDDICSRELWHTEGAYWPLDRPCNHTAELSAIDRGVRSPPVGVNVHVPTDSTASMKSVAKALRNPHSASLLRMPGRPYVLSIVRAIQTKKLHGATVRISHVRSHTGYRDLPSVGNAEADRLCGWLAHEPPDKNEEGKAEAYQMAMSSASV